MASEIRVDKITSLSGVGTISPSPTGVEIAGITTVATLKATTGIVTTLTTTTGIVTTLTTNTLTANSTTKVGSGITLSSDGDIFATGISTFADGVRIVGGSNSSNLKIITSNNDVGIVSSTNSAANFLIFDNDTENKIRTVDGRLHISADVRDAVVDSEIRFLVDNNIQAQVSAGSSFILANDTDTFLGHPAANTLTVTTAASERLRITSDGQILVGATSADADNKMLIQDSGTTILKINNTDDGTAQITLANTGSNNGQIKQVSGYMTFSIAGNEKLRIANNGELLVNATTISNAGGASPKMAIDVGDSNLHGLTIQAGGGESNGDLAGIAFGHGNTGDIARPKAAIAFNRAASYGRGDLCFYVDNAGDNNAVSSGDEKLRISRTGGITFNGDTATANALDDYEEGTFTPTTNQGSFTSAEGKYTKIGNQVTVWIYIPVISNTTSTDSFQIQSLPFSGAANMVQATGSVMIRYVDSTGISGVNFSTYQDSGWSYVRIYASRDDGNNYEVVRHSDFTQTSPGLRVCHTYQAA